MGKHIFFKALLFAGLCFVSLSSHSQTLSKKDTADIRFVNERKFFIYKVDKGETLFSISQKFKIPQEEIIQFNKEIEKNGLKAKMKLWVPAYSWLKKDSVEKKEVIEENFGKNIYNIAIVTSLNLPRIYTVDDTSSDYVDEPINRETKDNLEFVEGALNAADVLKPEGFKVHFYVIDSEGDSVKVLKKLKKNDGYNLIITNESGGMLNSISNYSQLKEINLLSCATNTTELIRHNKNAFSLVPSSGTQCMEMGVFAGKYFQNASLIVIKTLTTKENERSELFSTGWSKNQTSTIKHVDYVKGGNAAVTDNFVKDKNNIVFIASSNEDMVSSLLSAIKTKIPDYTVTVIGLPTWQYFETIDQKMLSDCNVHLFSSGFIDFNSPQVFALRKFFRDKYYTEPGENACQGFDAVFLAGKHFLANGKKMINETKPITVKGIYSDYFFGREENNGVYENKIIHVFQPSRDESIDLMKNFDMK